MAPDEVRRRISVFARFCGTCLYPQFDLARREYAMVELVSIIRIDDEEPFEAPVTPGEVRALVEI